MVRSLIFTFLFLLFVVFAFPIFYTNSQTPVTNDQKVTYELPFPGILPDSPLYFLKAARDRAMEMTTRDNMKKADMYLDFSDKRTRMAQLLSQKGKGKLSISTLSKGEKYFLKIPDLLADSKKQGVKYSDEFLFKLKSSNAKHKQIIEDLMKKAPQGEQESYQVILDYNTKIANALNSL